MITHLSYSQINEYLTCQRSYRFKYINEITTDANDALLFGSAWHKMISHYLLGKNYQVGWSEYSLDNQLPYALIDTGNNMLQSPMVASTLQGLVPAYLDHYIEFNIPQIDIPIIGYIDMIASDGVPVDFKTAGRKWTQERADKDLQPTFYLAGLHAQGFLKASDFPAKFRYIIFLKKAPYEVQIIETTRTAEDVLNLFSLVGECYRAIQAGVFLPTGVNSWKCSQNYCDFYQRCLGGRIDDVA